MPRLHFPTPEEMNSLFYVRQVSWLMRHPLTAFPLTQWHVGHRQQLQLRGQRWLCTNLPF